MEKDDFGCAIFTVDKKKMHWLIEAYGTIVKLTDDMVHFCDSEGKIYKVEIADFKFKKCEFKPVNKN